MQSGLGKEKGQRGRGRGEGRKREVRERRGSKSSNELAYTCISFH